MVDRHRYSQTSFLKRARVEDYNDGNYNLQRTLAKFFTDEQYHRFRLIQRDDDIIISGSTAIEFFDMTSFEGSDLDLYVYEECALTLVRFLQDIGYEFRAFPGMNVNVEDALMEARHLTTINLYELAGICGIFTFINDSSKAQIQVMTTHPHPVDIVLRFHSSEYK